MTAPRSLSIVIAMLLALLASPVASQAQRPGKVYRIGVLAIQDSPGWKAFREGLGGLGYVEGSNAAIEWRWPEGRLERFSRRPTGSGSPSLDPS